MKPMEKGSHASWTTHLRFGLRICSGCPWDIRLFFAAGAGELEPEEDASSVAAGAVRCGFKDKSRKGAQDWGTEHAGVKMKKNSGYTVLELGIQLDTVITRFGIHSTTLHH